MLLLIPKMNIFVFYTCQCNACTFVVIHKNVNSVVSAMLLGVPHVYVVNFTFNHAAP